MNVIFSIAQSSMMFHSCMRITITISLPQKYVLRFFCLLFLTDTYEPKQSKYSIVTPQRIHRWSRSINNLTQSEEVSCYSDYLILFYIIIDENLM